MPSDRVTSVDVNDQYDTTVVGTYKYLRQEGLSRPAALIGTPMAWFIMGFAIAAHREQQREKARIQQEERWRQEVRDNE